MTVIIPAFEPTEKLVKVVSDIKKETHYRIIVVDDGSGKEFEQLFWQVQNLGAEILYHSENKGKGAALKTAFKYLISHGRHGSVVCVDSDGQHHIKDIINVANAIDENKNQMVLGVREFAKDVPFKSRFGNKTTALLFKLVTGLSVSDTQTGLRGYPYSMLCWLLSVKGNRYEYEFNLLLDANQAGVSILQIPIKTIYENDNKGSHFNPVRDSFLIYLPLLKFGASSFASAIIDFSLLFLFKHLSGNLFLSVAFARVISSIFNYTLNKAMVFKLKKVSVMQSGIKYFSLVAVIMLLNYLLIAIMTRYLFLPLLFAKVLTEIILFIFSYIIQNKFVFISVNKTTA